MKEMIFHAYRFRENFSNKIIRVRHPPSLQRSGHISICVQHIQMGKLIFTSKETHESISPLLTKTNCFAKRFTKVGYFHV